MGLSQLPISGAIEEAKVFCVTVDIMERRRGRVFKSLDYHGYSTEARGLPSP